MSLGKDILKLKVVKMKYYLYKCLLWTDCNQGHYIQVKECGNQLAPSGMARLSGELRIDLDDYKLSSAA